MSLCFIQIEIMRNYFGRSECTGSKRCLSGLNHGDTELGFTLIELIMTLVIVGILAVAVAPRFLGDSVFKSRGFADQVQAALRYAQKEAIAQHRYVCAAFTGNSITLTIGATAACGTPLASPSGGAYAITAPSGIKFAAVPLPFSFNALGQPAPNAKKIISINGSSNSITVEAETGYVHSP
jgi:MSHA pilin protein MshC